MMSCSPLAGPESPADQETRDHRDSYRGGGPLSHHPLDPESYILHAMCLHVVCRTLYAGCGGSYGPVGPDLLCQIVEQPRCGLARALQFLEFMRVVCGNRLVGQGGSSLGPHDSAGGEGGTVDLNTIGG